MHLVTFTYSIKPAKSLNQLNQAKTELNESQKRVEQAEKEEEQVNNPVDESVLEENILESGKQEENAGGDDEETDVSGYFDAVDGNKKEKGVIKAPMPDDGEVIIYLKRRPSDGKFVVSTLGTGGEADNANVWISNIGHAPYAAAGEKIEDHSEQAV